MVMSRQASSVVSKPVGPMEFFVGDALPDLQLELDYDSGGPVVLTGATVTVAVSRLNGSTTVTSGTASLTDALNGRAIYSWGSFTFNSPGAYIGQCKVTFSGGKTQATQKFLINVSQKVVGL